MNNLNHLVKNGQNLMAATNQVCKEKIGECRTIVNHKVSGAVHGAITNAKQGAASYVAYSLGSLAAAPICYEIGKDLGKIAAVASVLGTSIMLTSFYLQSSRLVSKSVDLSALILSIMMIASLVYVHQDSIVMMTSELTKKVGVTLVGITCSFVALKSFGSTEVFLDPSNIGRSYPIKFLSSLIGMSLICQLEVLPEEYLSAMLSKIILEAILYNTPQVATKLINKTPSLKSAG